MAGNNGYAAILLMMVTLCVLAGAPCVSAEVSSTQATVTVTVLNEPPVISSISMSPGRVYADSVVGCVATTVDEVPERLSLQYTWYLNGETLGAQGSSLDGAGILHEGDTLGCSVLATDHVGQRSDAFLAQAAVANPGARVKAEQLLLGVFGAKADTATVVSLEQEGLVAMTGFAVRNAGSSDTPAYWGILLFGIMLLVLVNINVGMRALLSRKRSRTASQKI